MAKGLAGGSAGGGGAPMPKSLVNAKDILGSGAIAAVPLTQSEKRYANQLRRMPVGDPDRIIEARRREAYLKGEQLTRKSFATRNAKERVKINKEANRANRRAHVLKQTLLRNI